MQGHGSSNSVRWPTQDGSQAERVFALAGAVPATDINAPFRGVTEQHLTPGIAYGTLRFVPAAELAGSELGHDTIVVTDDVPNDLPLVGGLITEAFQTPLSHVNTLSQNRGTPNLSLANARTNPRLASHFEQLVRLQVTVDTFRIEQTTHKAAEAFWAEHWATAEVQAPRLDTSTTDLVELATASLADLPRIGAKAAQLAELLKHEASATLTCPGGFAVPEAPFAIPVAAFIEHAERSGAAELLSQLEAGAAGAARPQVPW